MPVKESEKSLHRRTIFILKKDIANSKETSKFSLARFDFMFFFSFVCPGMLKPAQPKSRLWPTQTVSLVSRHRTRRGPLHCHTGVWRFPPKTWNKSKTAECFPLQAIYYLFWIKDVLRMKSTLSCNELTCWTISYLSSLWRVLEYWM